MSSAHHAHAAKARNSRRSGGFDLVGRLKRIAMVFADAGSRWVDDACYRTAASIAYYAIFSLFPLLLVAVTVLGFFLGGDPSSREKIVASASKVLSPQFRALLDDTLTSMQAHAQARGIGAAIGAITLLFGASGVFSELDTALNSIWRVPKEDSSGLGATIRHALRDKAVAFAAVAGAGAILLLSLLVSTALAAISAAFERVIPASIVWRAVDALVSLGLTTLVFAVIFRTLPRIRVVWKDVLGGAFFTAVSFGVLKHLLAWYLGHVGSYAAYGAVGAVLALLTWIYLVSLVLLFGAELTRAHAEREGSLAALRGPKEGRTEGREGTLTMESDRGSIGARLARPGGGGLPMDEDAKDAKELSGKRVAMLVAEGFEQVELTAPREALQKAGAKVEIVSPTKGRVRAWKMTDWGDEFDVDVPLEDAVASDYDALVLPGGVMNPDKLRIVPEAQAFVREFFEDEKPVAAICHGPWTLIDAGVVEGKRLTSWPTLRTDLTNAGAEWMDESVVVDGELLTSRKPDDIPSFNREMIALIAGRGLVDGNTRREQTRGPAAGSLR